MLNEGVGSWPYRRVRREPDRVAMTFRDTATTYAELAERVTRLAHALRRIGVGEGDRVGLVSFNHPAYIEVLFACGLLGAIFVPLNARLTVPELRFCIEDSETLVLLHSAALTSVARDAADLAGTARRVVFDGEPDAGALGYEAMIAAAEATPVDDEVLAEDPCFIMYTSGTTGRPKGVVLTHHNVTFAVLNPVVDLDLGSDEVALVCSPLFHTAALGFIALPTLFKGGTVHIEEGFDAGRVLEAIERRRVTYAFAVPSMCNALSGHPAWASADLSSLRRLVVAAAPVPLRTLRTFADRGVRICQAYGLTESGPGALILTPADAERKLGTAGVPHFFTEVRLVDAAGVPVRAGERGEIQIRGPHVTSGYWNRADATADAFAEGGWFRSGDIGVADDEGFVTIVDRLKDMIISGGENVYPAEVEAALYELPGVVECAVFGVSPTRSGGRWAARRSCSRRAIVRRLRRSPRSSGNGSPRTRSPSRSCPWTPSRATPAGSSSRTCSGRRRVTP